MGSNHRIELLRNEILLILESADHLIGQAGRSMLAKLLKGSKDKKLLSLHLHTVPEYGLLSDFTLEKIGQYIEWMIHHEFLEIEYTGYKGRMPVLVFTWKGWAIQKEQVSGNLLAEWIHWKNNKITPASMEYLKDRNREMIMHLLEKIKATGDLDLIPFLKQWQKIDYRKVREAIDEVIQHLQKHPVRDESVFARHAAEVDRLLGRTELVPERLKCWDCGERFIFEVEEQKHFRSNGYAPPKRCPDCREKKWLMRMGLDEY